MKRYLLALLLLAPAVATAHEYTAGGLKIGHPWTRATPVGSDMAAGYLTVTNTGKAPDVLEGATATGVESVMIHQTREDKGVVHMDMLHSGVEIQPGETLTLKPGGVHLMWMGVKAPLKAGDMVSGTLVFKNAGTVPVGFKVEAMGAMEPAHQH